MSRTKSRGPTWAQRLGRLLRTVTRRQRGAVLKIRLEMLPGASPADMVKVLRAQADLMERNIAAGAKLDRDESFTWERE